MSNYVIGYDRDGSIFIAHSSDRPNHKYFRKIKDGTRTRYFYSEQEWNAYMKNRNRPKTQAEIQKERKANEDALRKSSKEVKQASDLLNWIKKQRDSNRKTLKAYEDEHKEKLERAAKDPNYKVSQMEKWILEDGIKELRESDKEWTAWAENGEKDLQMMKKSFSDALRKVNTRQR